MPYNAVHYAARPVAALALMEELEAAAEAAKATRMNRSDKVGASSLCNDNINNQMCSIGKEDQP